MQENLSSQRLRITKKDVFAFFLFKNRFSQREKLLSRPESLHFLLEIDFLESCGRGRKEQLLISHCNTRYVHIVQCN